MYNYKTTTMKTQKIKLNERFYIWVKNSLSPESTTNYNLCVHLMEIDEYGQHSGLFGTTFNDNTESIKILIDWAISRLKEYNNIMIPFKTYNVRYNIGNSKYVVMFNDGIKTHKDGSKFYDINIFKNKKDLNSFIKELKEKYYFEME